MRRTLAAGAAALALSVFAGTAVPASADRPAQTEIGTACVVERGNPQVCGGLTHSEWWAEMFPGVITTP